jgi:hypothetical protein
MKRQQQEDPTADTTMDAEDSKPKKTKNNDIRDIRSLRQLERVDFDYESPRLKQAMDDLGVSIEECQKK